MAQMPSLSRRLRVLVADDLRTLIHLTPEGQERFVERVADLNREAIEEAEKDKKSLQFLLRLQIDCA